VIAYRRGVFGSSLALFLVSGGALAQNAPTVQGMPPVSSPNAPATQTPLPAPTTTAPAPTAAPTYVPPALPQAPVVTAPHATPGGTSIRQLGAPLAPGAFPQGPATSSIESQLTALIGRSGGLTADQAARRARQTSYDVQARKAESAAAQTSVDQASLAYIPRIKGTASYTRTSPVNINLAGFSLTFPNNNYNLQADIDVPLSDYVLKIAKHHASVEHSAKAAELTEKAAEITASSNARILYYSWARARLNLVVSEASLENAKQHLADAKSELAAGKASQADVMGVQAELAQSDLLVTRAQNAVALEEDRLRTALHDQSPGAYEIGEPLLADLGPMQGQESFNGLLEEALHQRYELRSITETAQGLHLEAQASKFDILPKLDAIGNAQYANPNPRWFPPPPDGEWKGTWALGGALTWSATDIVLGSTNGSAAESRAQSTEAQALALRDGIRDEVMEAWQGVRESEMAIRSTQESLAAAEESYRVRRALFRADRATSTELTDSENALTRARFESVNARIDLRIARVRLAHATGRDDLNK
jgi:outer membrane protein TolC